MLTPKSILAAQRYNGFAKKFFENQDISGGILVKK
jgi:hypothetical protein